MTKRSVLISISVDITSTDEQYFSTLDISSIVFANNGITIGKQLEVIPGGDQPMQVVSDTGL